MTSKAAPAFGSLLKEWRVRRRKSQMELAAEAHVSSKHLSFLETGRAQPSRDMVLTLAEELKVPLREQNMLLAAAGFAPSYTERSLQAPEFSAVRRAVELIVAGHEPYPALAVDRHWNMVTANRTVMPLLQGVDAALLEPPVNVLRLSLHPAGLASRIINCAEWRSHLVQRLSSQIESTGDPVLRALLDELNSFPQPVVRHFAAAGVEKFGGVAVPLQLMTPLGVLNFLSTTTVFGSPLNVTISELAIESFFPADEKTGEILRKNPV